MLLALLSLLKISSVVPLGIDAATDDLRIMVPDYIAKGYAEKSALCCPCLTFPCRIISISERVVISYDDFDRRIGTVPGLDHQDLLVVSVKIKIYIQDLNEGIGGAIAIFGSLVFSSP